MDRHLREFYHLGKAAVTEPWQRAEFLRIISAAGATQGKVFTWRVPSTQGGTQATYAVLYNDPGTKRWVVVQFYKEGKRAREFATAFMPTEAQKAAMLEEIAIKRMSDSKVHCGLYDPDRSTDELLAVTTEAAREAGLGPAVGASVVAVPLRRPRRPGGPPHRVLRPGPGAAPAMDRDGSTPGRRDHVRAAGHRRCGP